VQDHAAGPMVLNASGGIGLFRISLGMSLRGTSIILTSSRLHPAPKAASSAMRDELPASTFLFFTRWPHVLPGPDRTATGRVSRHFRTDEADLRWRPAARATRRGSVDRRPLLF